MATVTRWWWIRHAPVTAYSGRIYGQTDVPAEITDNPIYGALAGALPEGAVWVTSHLQRTKQTAEAIRAAGLDFDRPIVAHALAEQNFGEWQGQNRAKIYAQYAPDHKMWLAPAAFAPPGGESFAEMMERVAGAITDLTRVYAGQDIVAVAHGGSIRCAIGHALDLDPDGSIRFMIDNCSVTRLEYIEGGDAEPIWQVSSVNELLHRPADGARGPAALA